VGRLAAERDLAVRSRVKVGAEGNQPAHGVRRAFHQLSDSLWIAEPRSRCQRVGRMQRRTIVRTNGRGESALRVASVAFAQYALGQQGDAQLRRQREGEGQTSHPGADDNDVIVLSVER
jgi:hypothetical protein